MYTCTEITKDLENENTNRNTHYLQLDYRKKTLLVVTGDLFLKFWFASHETVESTTLKR